MKLVSCICPSKRDAAHLQRTIDNFAAQTYGPKELVVLRALDGVHYHESVKKPDGIDLRVRFVPAGLSIGELRNVAIRLSRGSCIATWDDDDYSHPERLARSMAAIDAGAMLVGSSRVIYETERDGFCGGMKRYLFDGGKLTPKYLVGGTLVYRRELWERRPFEDVETGEDSRFLWGCLRDMKAIDGEQFPGLDIVDLADETLYTATLSPDATSQKDVSSLGWGGIR